MLHSRSSKRQQRLTSALRYAGNALLVIGHFTLLWGDTEPALHLHGGGLVAKKMANHQLRLQEIAERCPGGTEGQ